jgi:hypothetical protein
MRPDGLDSKESFYVRDLFWTRQSANPTTHAIVGVTSRYHSLTLPQANKWRKLVVTPWFQQIIQGYSDSRLNS